LWFQSTSTNYLKERATPEQHLREASILPAHIEDAHDAVEGNETDEIVGRQWVYRLGQRPLGLLKVLGADRGVNDENVYAGQLRDRDIGVGCGWWLYILYDSVS
jgi:hypothetical protein